jgi:hypothetical protein
MHTLSKLFNCVTNKCMTFVGRDCLQQQPWILLLNVKFLTILTETIKIRKAFCLMTGTFASQRNDSSLDGLLCLCVQCRA